MGRQGYSYRGSKPMGAGLSYCIGRARSGQTDRSAAADGRHEMDLGSFADPLHQAHASDFAVHGDGQVGPDVAVLNQAAGDAGETCRPTPR